MTPHTILKRILSELGYRQLEAESGKETKTCLQINTQAIHILFSIPSFGYETTRWWHISRNRGSCSSQWQRGGSFYLSCEHRLLWCQLDPERGKCLMEFHHKTQKQSDCSPTQSDRQVQHKYRNYARILQSPTPLERWDEMITLDWMLDWLAERNLVGKNTTECVVWS